ncbi:hypothetical protein ACIP4U_36425 [Streptomyces caelestis]|uniref:hypothetical protein n=1 Tax=Streptomyces caelestis TaxID=36816 RepID=UPI003810F73C
MKGGVGGYVERDGWQLLAGQSTASAFKHELLRRYIPPFGGMTSTQSQDRRVVYVDGYAGEGRYESGEPGSAEIALRLASYYRSHGLTTLLDRVHAAHLAEHGHAGHSRVPDAVMWPHTAASSMPELIPRS